MNDNNLKNKAVWQDYIINIPDYPKPGVGFKDITPLIGHAQAFKSVIDELAVICERGDIRPEQLACPEARGFMFGSALAYRLGTGFLPVRKPGKLPRKTCGVEYELEYGTDSLQMHAEDIIEGQRVVLIDDVLATGGTMAACVKILQDNGAIVPACVFVMELDGLRGREKITQQCPAVQVHSLITY
ncbi:MAG: adenine phosphoribosyltransferase [Gammaproteobacteria bacterium]|nr:MAG: adenine phosphoribosyltransferase [Gammaproteobacteria bacterium]